MRLEVLEQALKFRDGVGEGGKLLIALRIVQRHGSESGVVEADFVEKAGDLLGR